MKRLFLLSAAVLFLSASGCSSAADSAQALRHSRDVLLVLDTSKSMTGRGGKNILSDVKRSLNSYIDGLQSGDRVTYMTFDTSVKCYPSVELNSASDADTLRRYVAGTSADGLWTHTYRMIDEVFKKADDLQKQQQGRQPVIVIMTDGVDDPPPSSDAHRFNIKDIASGYEGRDWWIFMVNFQDLKNARKSGQADEIRESLKQVSDKSYVIDASEAGAEAAVEQVMDQENRLSLLPLILAVLVIILLALFAVLFILKRRSQLKVCGTLEYWNNDLIKPYPEHFNMTRYMSRNIFVGNRPGATLKILDLELRNPFVLTAEREKSTGKIRVRAVPGDGMNIIYLNKDRSADAVFLDNGEAFAAGNFIFRYYEE